MKQKRIQVDKTSNQITHLPITTQHILPHPNPTINTHHHLPPPPQSSNTNNRTPPIHNIPRNTETNTNTSSNQNLYQITPARKLLNFTGSKLTIQQAQQVLQVDNNTNKRTIRLKYKSLARKYHPDKWVQQCEFSKEQGSNFFKDISNAYQILIKWCKN